MAFSIAIGLMFKVSCSTSTNTGVAPKSWNALALETKVNEGTITSSPGPTLVSSAEETAKDLYRVLQENNALASIDGPPPTYEFQVTGDPKHFKEFGRRFLGPEVNAVDTINLPGLSDH